MDHSLKLNYLCPHCKSYLRVWINIIFIIESDEKNLKGILLLNPGLGNYEFIHHSSIKLAEGEVLTFLCPVCRTDLTATEINSNLVKILMTDENNREFEVYFSMVCGEHSTFLMKNDNVVEKFGDASSSYVNHFMSKLKHRGKT
jgi:RNA polymerase subunit RPABC4/transcription elongation factor Spt4